MWIKMVVTIIWIKPWVIIMISLSVLLVVTILFYCVCCKRNKDKSRFYILDENGFRTASISEFAQNSLTNLRLYRKLSTSKETKNEQIFTSKSLPFFKISNNMISDSELLDSMDAVESFENSTLQITEDESQNDTKEDLYSCISSDSQYTYYSIHPTLTKSNSRGTFVSVDFNCDTETLID